MILIVDDRPENILPLKKILEQHQFSVDTAESGEEALKKVLANNYAVIILDVQMPGMDGFEVANFIGGYSKAKDTSIIFLSAVNKEKEFITKGYTSGGIDYLTKPVDPDILLLKVKILNRLYEQQQELRATQETLLKEIEVRKQAEEQLAKGMQELRSIVESLPQMAFTIASAGKIEYVNEHWYKYSRQLDQFPEMHPDDNIHLEWETYLKQGVEYIKETRLKDLATGEYRYHLLRITPIKFEEVTIRWVGTFTDIHQQKINAEILEQKVELRTKELLDKNVELERTNHELQQFAWVVSHDLKEPLRKIQIFNGVIKEKYLKDNNEAISYLDRSIQSSARMSRLISDVLEYSRLSNSSSFQETNLNEILHELLIDFDDLISRKEALISVGNLPVISAMPSRIRQVFQNLISNALKFSKPTVAPVIHITGELVEDKSIDSPAKENGAFCRIIVEDNGIGFDEKFLNRIFIIFQRLNDQNSYEGTGIGLAIAKKNIDTHNGIISAKSQIGEGTSFIIVLPVNQTNHVLK